MDINGLYFHSHSEWSNGHCDCRLYLEDLDAKTLLSCIAGCRNLRSLEVAKSSSATLRPCLSAKRIGEA